MDQRAAETEQTVKLSRNDIRAARRLLRLLLGIESEHSVDLPLEPRPLPVGEITRSDLIARAREEFGNRRRRLAIFDRAMFGEAAWDMLLALYVLDVSGQRQTVGSLLKFSGTPISTAIRWLNFLESRDFVRRDPHPTDLRTAFVGLTSRAREKLDLYYSETVATEI